MINEVRSGDNTKTNAWVIIVYARCAFVVDGLYRYT